PFPLTDDFTASSPKATRITRVSGRPPMALTGSAVRAIGLGRVAPVSRRLTPPERYAFGASLGSIQARHSDPCVRVSASELWMAARTPDGPGTFHLELSA